MTAIHSEQLADYGGAYGLRDQSLFVRVLARAENLAAYSKPDIYALAAAYASGINRNHPFIDGNKRTGFIAAAMFLDLNNYELTASEAAAVTATLALTAGDLSEKSIADWLKANSKAI